MNYKNAVQAVPLDIPVTDEYKIYCHNKDKTTEQYPISLLKYRNGVVFDKVTTSYMDTRTAQKIMAEELQDFLGLPIEYESVWQQHANDKR